MARPLNFLLVLTTQWRGMSCGFSGDTHALTPCLDALAFAKGEIHGQAVTPHPFGPFARAAALTGVPSPQNGVGEYFDPLPAGSRTLAHVSREFGYKSFYFGKWHLSRRDPQAPLVGQAHARTVVPEEARGGFDFWEGFESGFLLNDPWLHGTELEVPRLFQGYQSRVVCGRAGDRLCGETTGRPWFAVVSLEAPHPPYGAPAPGGEGPEPVLPPNVPMEPGVRARALGELAGYHRHIRATEREIAELVGRIRIHSPDTVMIVTSVHGDQHGAHGLFRKGWPHEECVRIPWVVFWPESWGRVGRSETPVSLLDLREWLTKAAEGQPWSGDPGRRCGLSMPSVVSLADQCDRVWSGWRTATEKRIFNADGSPWLQFNLLKDPWEMKNLVGSREAS